MPISNEFLFPKELKEKEMLGRMYIDEKMTIRQIAKVVGMHYESVRKRLIKYNIQMRTAEDYPTTHRTGMRKPHQYKKNEDGTYSVKTEGQKEQWFIIDEQDLHLIFETRWGFTNGYVRGKYNGKDTGIARVIVAAQKNEVVDHINHDTLDNRRCNLRVCTNQQNSMNQRPQAGKSSKYKGVSKTIKYQASISYNGKSIHLGVFDDEIEAAKAYDVKAKELFGEFAYLNFPTPGGLTQTHNEKR